MLPKNPKYTYNGYKYFHEIDREDDNEKICHTVVDPSGEFISFDFNPYREVSAEDFGIWVDLGCPGRIGTHALDSEVLEEMRSKRMAAGFG